MLRTGPKVFLRWPRFLVGPVWKMLASVPNTPRLSRNLSDSPAISTVIYTVISNLYRNIYRNLLAQLHFACPIDHNAPCSSCTQNRITQSGITQKLISAFQSVCCSIPTTAA